MTSFTTLRLPLASLGAAVLLLSISACGGNQDTRGGDGAAIPTDTAASSAPVAAGDSSAVKTYVFHGTVKAIDTARGMITIDHEQIGDYMEAMTMPFKVADPALLSQVTVGKATHFTLRVAGSRALIVKVQEGHDAGQEH